MKKQYIIKAVVNGQNIFYKSHIYIDKNQIVKVLTKNLEESMKFNRIDDANKILIIIQDPIFHVIPI